MALALAGCVVAAMTSLRRSPDLVNHIYDAGNVLGTHHVGALTLVRSGEWLARLELGALALLLGLVARRVSRAGVVASVAAFVVVFVDSVLRSTTTIAGRTYVLLFDDALISMRYARNLADGHGLVYNPGEKVEGFSNLLWTLLMVIPHKLGIHEGLTTAFVAAVGGVLMVATALLATHALEGERVAGPLQVLTVLVMSFDPSVLEFAVLGLETPLLAFGAALVVVGQLRARERWIQAGIAILVLARADGVVVAGLLLGWLVLDEARTGARSLLGVARARWTRFALLAFVVAAVLGWRLATYGYLAPNTYYLKVYPFADRIWIGLASYGVRGLVMYGIPAAFVLVAASLDDRARRARSMLLPVVGVWLYGIYVGGDSFRYMRFFGPVTPVLWISVALAGSSVLSRARRGTDLAVGALLVATAPLFCERGVIGFSGDNGGWVRDNIVTAKTIARNVPPDAGVVLFAAGLAYYAPDHRFVDALGKVDRHIGHQTTVHGSLPGHNKFDFAYVYDERKPAVTFAGMSCDEVESRIATGDAALETTTRGANLFYAPVFQLLNPTFRAKYHPHRVQFHDGDKLVNQVLGCLFVREGANVPLDWQRAER